MGQSEPVSTMIFLLNTLKITTQSGDGVVNSSRHKTDEAENRRHKLLGDHETRHRERSRRAEQIRPARGSGKCVKALRFSERVRTPLMSLVARAAIIREKSCGHRNLTTVGQRRIEFANKKTMSSQLRATIGTTLQMIFKEQRRDPLPVRRRRKRRSDFVRRSFPDAVACSLNAGDSLFDKLLSHHLARAKEPVLDGAERQAGYFDNLFVAEVL